MSCNTEIWLAILKYSSTAKKIDSVCQTVFRRGHDWMGDETRHTPSYKAGWFGYTRFTFDNELETVAVVKSMQCPDLYCDQWCIGFLGLGHYMLLTTALTPHSSVRDHVIWMFSCLHSFYKASQKIAAWADHLAGMLYMPTRDCSSNSLHTFYHSRH